MNKHDFCLLPPYIPLPAGVRKEKACSSCHPCAILRKAQRCLNMPRTEDADPACGCGSLSCFWKFSASLPPGRPVSAFELCVRRRVHRVQRETNGQQTKGKLSSGFLLFYSKNLVRIKQFRLLGCFHIQLQRFIFHQNAHISSRI